jgi:hypothetical protein
MGWFQDYTMTEWLLGVIAGLLVIIIGQLERAAKQRYAIAKLMSRGEALD